MNLFRASEGPQAELLNVSVDDLLKLKENKKSRSRSSALCFAPAKISLPALLILWGATWGRSAHAVKILDERLL
jgi:hypothetical protein